MISGSLQLRFHHVGIVVASIDDCLAQFMRSIGAARHTEIVLDPIQRVKVVFLVPEAAGEAQIELVEPVERSPPSGDSSSKAEDFTTSATRFPTWRSAWNSCCRRAPL